MADRPMGCGVIQDLLPLYVDGAAGEESRALVEEHLRSCPVCHRELEQLRGGWSFRRRRTEGRSGPGRRASDAGWSGG